MNNPARDVLKEITRATDFGFDFLDLTLEPPAARADRVDAKRIRAALEAKELGVVGHTAYYLPFGSAFDAVQAAAITETERCLEVFAEVGVTLMNLHLDCRVPGHDPSFVNRRNLESIEKLLPTAERLGITLMVENVEGDDADSLAPVLDALAHRRTASGHRACEYRGGPQVQHGIAAETVRIAPEACPSVRQQGQIRRSLGESARGLSTGGGRCAR
jgi:sugar phosphate isomerase/epimerase